MTGACCTACARARGCKETNYALMRAGHQCGSFRPVGLPVLRARFDLALLIGDTAMWEAVTSKDEEEEDAQG